MISNLIKINNFLTSKKMGVIDYIGAFLTLGYAGYKFYMGQDYLLWAIAGVIALVFAIVKPAKLIVKKYGRNNLNME